MNSQRRVWGLLILVAAAVLLASCAPVGVRITAEPGPQARAGDGETPPPPTPTSPPAAPAADPENPCNQPPVAAPTPAPDPGYAQLDPSTGLHVTGKMQLIDLATYRLRVTGKVEKPLELSYDQIRCLPKVQASPILTCPGFFTDEATWAGAPIAEVLALAVVQDGAQSVQFVSADGYKTSLSLEKAMDRANFLAYEWEGQPLPRLHGFPLRVVISEAEGNQWTKWVVEMKVE